MPPLGIAILGGATAIAGIGAVRKKTRPLI
jgi:hypothetical protein